MRAPRRGFLALFLSSVLPLALSGCFAPGDGVDDPGVTEWALSTAEGFESATKSAYATADVTLSSGTWSFDDALIGVLASDVKNGSHSARLRNSGRLTMGFDRTTGAGTVTIKHASFGSDASGTWALYYSQDHGSSWSQVGSSRATSAGALATASFSVNRTGVIRFEIRKTDGGANRINVDDVSIADYSGGGGGGGSGGGGGGGGGSGGGGSGGGGGSTGGAAISVHTTLGIPSPSATSTWNSYLSVKSQYVVSYNSSRKVPNWVSWELNSSYLGGASRTNAYRADDTLPSGMAQASPADYSGSGYERGHMCPSGDRTLTTTANAQTFYLSNMVPQAANNNSGPWEKLETYSRTLASQGKELFIIAGGIFSSHSGTIGSGVAVPDKTFKVVVVFDKTGQGPSAVTTNTRVIGVIMPNDDSQIATSDTWQSYRVAVRSIEDQTGLDFLSDVDPGVQDAVETRIDNQ